MQTFATMVCFRTHVDSAGGAPVLSVDPSNLATMQNNHEVIAPNFETFILREATKKARKLEQSAAWAISECVKLSELGIKP